MKRNLFKKPKFMKRRLAKDLAAIVAVVGIGILGAYLISASHAASPYVSFEAENGKLAEGVSLQSMSNASEGQYVQFGQTTSSNLAVHVSGDQLVNGQGNSIRLLGTDASNSEYCTQHHTVADGDPLDSAEAADLASWKMNAVRIPLNEDCWLGINGVTINGESAAASAATYQTAIKDWVNDLNKDGIIAVIDLHWAAPGTYEANQQWPMADADHSPAFWTSIAGAFKSDPAVMFDVYNEPQIGNPKSPTVSAQPWSCWLSGCAITFPTDSNGPITTVTYTTAGMQQLVDAIRATGAMQPIILAGLNSSSDPCGINNKYSSTAACPELANMPTDPLHQLVVDMHVYYPAGSTATTAYWNAHWNSELDPLQAAEIPLVTDEFGESDCSSSFMNMYMTWADQNNESYLAWSWDPSKSPTDTCVVGSDSNYLLLSDWNGDPSTLIPQGANYKAHLAAVSP